MFNLGARLYQAAQAVKSLFSPPPPPAPKAPTTVWSNPVTNYIANNTSLGRGVSTVVNNVGRAVTRQPAFDWQAAARADAERRAREEAERKARIRRETLARLETFKTGTRAILKAGAENQKKRWQTHFRADGRLLNGQQYDDKTATPEMRVARQNWINSFDVDNGAGDDNGLRDIFITTRDKYRKDAEKILAQLNTQSKGVIGSFTSQMKTRQFAQAQQGKLQDSIKKYEDFYSKVNKEKAKKESHLNWLQNNGSQEEYERYYNETSNWLRVQARDLEYRRGAVMGMNDAYGTGKDLPIKGFIGGIGNALNTAKNATGAFLGGAMQKIGGIVEMPNRAVVTANAFLGSKVINKNDGSQVSTPKTLTEIWNATKDARGFNRGTPAMTNPDVYYKNLYEKLQVARTGQSYQQWYKKHQKDLDKRYVNDQAGDATIDQVTNFFADPVMGAPKLGGVAKWLGTSAKTVSKTTGATAQLQKLTDTKVGQGLKWLNQEYKTSGQKFAEKSAPKWAQVRNQAESIKRSFAVFKDNQKAFAKSGKAEREKATTHFYKLLRNKDENVVYLAQQLLRHKELGVGLPKNGFKVDVGTGVKRRTLDFGKMTKDQYKEAVQLRDELAKFSGELYTKERGMGEKMKRWYQKRGDYNKKTSEGLRYKGMAGYIPEKSFGISNKVTKKKPNFGIPFLEKQRKKTLQSPKRLSKSLANRYYQHGRWINKYVDTPKFFSAMKNKSSKIGSEINDLKMGKEKDVPSLKNIAVATVKGREWWKQLTPAQKAKYAGRALKSDIGDMPMNVWRAGVLATRPAWYVNNKAYNTFAGLQAGGLDYVSESLKMLRKGGLTKARRENPEVVSQIGQYGGSNKLYKAASALEDHDRLAAFRAVKSRHPEWSDERSLKEVNKWLLDYKTKNWERPLKGVMPFWSWTKGITKANLRMQVEKPVSAKIINENNKNNEREVNKIDERNRAQFRNKQYMGRDKDGNPKFMSTPFNPFNQSNFSVNPFLDVFAQISSQKDFYGNPLQQKNLKQNALEKFPLPSLVKRTTEALKNPKNVVKYFAERGKNDPAMTKERQGYDKSKGNYKSSLDPSHKLHDDWLAYLGKPRTSTYDKKRAEREIRLTKLNTEFFGTDWDKKFTKEQYNEKVAAQQALAKKYGFDLEKDLYKGLWSKNDTELTKGLKQQKEEARNYLSQFWKEYHDLPQDGNRNVWVKNKLKEVERSGILQKNAFIFDGLPDWFNPSSRERAVTKEFWNSYFASDKETRKRLLSNNPKYNKYGNSSYTQSAKKTAYLKAKASGNWSEYNRLYGKYPSTKTTRTFKTYTKRPYDKEKVERAQFWRKFYEADKETRKALMRDNPKYNKFANEPEPTQEQWDQLVADRRARERTRAKTSTTFLSAYTASLSDAERKAFLFMLSRQPKAKKLKIK